MVSRNVETSQVIPDNKLPKFFMGDGGTSSGSSAPFDRPRPRPTNTIFKSGPLFISSKGIGWTSWKKRWFILTRTSLVFFRNDPSALPQKGGEVNLTLGGIDLNNSGSVVVRADKKLLTVLFPDGRDGRAFTLKAETSEDMYEWKTALDNALAQAPSAALVMGQNAIFRNDAADTIEGTFEHWRDRRPVKSMVVGRPILLALEDIDGGPSFLEKALRFLEQFGVKVEGILRQAADVEEVDRRVQEYEDGKTEFSPDEDAHVVGDCVKHVLRELPSSPVPASCCTALLEAYRTKREARADAMRAAISETFPEPNRRLLQRVLKMMHTIASHTSENRMSPSAVAACMAPLLLRPLLAGDCEIEDDFDMDSDGSAQLMAAAAAANSAHAIVTTLLEEYENIFEDGQSQKDSLSPDIYSETEESGSEEYTDDEAMDMADDGYHDAKHDLDPDIEVDHERVLSGTRSESSGNAGSDLYDYKGFEGLDSDADSPEDNNKCISVERSLKEASVPVGDQNVVQQSSLKEASVPVGDQNVVQQISLKEASVPVGDQNVVQQSSLKEASVPVGDQNVVQQSSGTLQSPNDKSSTISTNESHEAQDDPPTSASPKLSTGLSPASCVTKSTGNVNGSVTNAKRPTIWGRTSARKNLSMESIDSSSEDESAIQRLEITKNDLRNKIAKETKENAILQASLERRKQALHERRLALEQDVARLQEQLQKERDLRALLEAGLNMPSEGYAISSSMDSKTKVELEEIALAEADVMKLKQKVADLHVQLNQQRQHRFGSVCNSCGQYQHSQNIQWPGKLPQQDHEITDQLESTQKSEQDVLFGADWENLRPQGSPSTQKRHPPQKKKPNSMSLTDSPRCTFEEPSTLETNRQTAMQREGKVYKRQPAGYLALAELTTRLGLLKQRRSQLVEELHNIDGSKTTTSQGPKDKAPSGNPVKMMEG
ncbi:hypothetical protein AMTRI_Chr04g187340 [Amborella trichopoda]|uniref:rho GTPase-activating protein 7 isoform X2 n=1 Tax=Amborella trichopoda TaxID=13333 RepID=UPI0009C09552|nr:rho GTPase-activating protein 7 isoform X2 [Amborella trichopoda]|eukprot:XP_020520969.1 rho GTPase-activating protein 7 isoform X2 [Amborella trichopoda]